MLEFIQRLVNALPEQDRNIALANVAQRLESEQMAQFCLNLSYLPNVGRVLDAGQHLWPPNDYAHIMLAAPSVGRLVQWLARADLGLLCSPVVFTSAQHFDVYFGDDYGYFYRGSQGERIQRTAIQLWLSALLSLLAWLGASVRALQVDLPWYQPDDLPQYLQAWHIKVLPGGRFPVLRIPTSVWQAPLPRGNQHVFNPLPNSHFIAAVRAQILAKQDLLGTAAALNMSAATLKRQLNKRQTSFRQQQHLINAMLCDHGERYQGVDKAELMARFAMYDRSTFNRAYQRWFAQIKSVTKGGF